MLLLLCVWCCFYAKRVWRWLNWHFFWLMRLIKHILLLTYELPVEFVSNLVLILVHILIRQHLLRKIRPKSNIEKEKKTSEMVSWIGGRSQFCTNENLIQFLTNREMKSPLKIYLLYDCDTINNFLFFLFFKETFLLFPHPSNKLK